MIPFKPLYPFHWSQRIQWEVVRLSSTLQHCLPSCSFERLTMRASCKMYAIMASSILSPLFSMPLARSVTEPPLQSCDRKTHKEKRMMRGSLTWVSTYSWTYTMCWNLWHLRCAEFPAEEQRRMKTFWSWDFTVRERDAEHNSVNL